MKKKNHTNTYLKIWLIFIISTLIVSCEKESILDESEKSTGVVIKKSLHKSIINFDAIQKNTDLQNGFRYLEEYLNNKNAKTQQFSINKNSAQVLKSKSFISYTFTVNRKNQIKMF